MSEKKVLDKSVLKKVVSIIESLGSPYPDVGDKSRKELMDRIEFLTRAATVIFVLNFSKACDENGFIDRYNAEGVISKLMKIINPEIYSEFFFLRERGIV